MPRDWVWLSIQAISFTIGQNLSDYDRLLKYVYQVYLRDTTKDKLQVRIGQGIVEYGRLVDRLLALKYENALTVHIVPSQDIDHLAELRKLRLLLESLLI